VKTRTEAVVKLLDKAFTPYQGARRWQQSLRATTHSIPHTARHCFSHSRSARVRATRLHHGQCAAPTHTERSGPRYCSGAHGDCQSQAALWVARGCAGAQLLRGGSGWLLAPPVFSRPARREHCGGLLQHRGAAPEAPGEDGPLGCAQAAHDAVATSHWGTKVWSVVRVLSVTDEDRRQLHRDLLPARVTGRGSSIASRAY